MANQVNNPKQAAKQNFKAAMEEALRQVGLAGGAALIVQDTGMVSNLAIVIGNLTEFLEQGLAVTGGNAGNGN